MSSDSGGDSGSGSESTSESPDGRIDLSDCRYSERELMTLVHEENPNTVSDEEMEALEEAGLTTKPAFYMQGVDDFDYDDMQERKEERERRKKERAKKPDWKTETTHESIGHYLLNHAVEFQQPDGLPDTVKCVYDHQHLIEWLTSEPESDREAARKDRIEKFLLREIAVDDDAEIEDLSIDDIQDYMWDGATGSDTLLNEFEVGRGDTTPINLPEEQNIDLTTGKSRKLGEWVEVEGRVVHSTSLIPYVKEAVYACKRCGTTNRIVQEITKSMDLTTPHECQGCERQGPFEFMSERSEWGDFREIKIKQTLKHTDSDNSDGIKVRMTDQFDPLAPGEDVTVTGKMKAIPEQKMTAEPWIDAAHIDTGREDVDHEIMEEEREEIREIVNSDNTLERAAELSCPVHKGDQIAKKTLALQAMGAPTEELQNDTTRRGEIHCFLVGDPGTDKTGLMRSAENLWRIVQRASNTDTEAGLTTAADREEIAGSETWTLKSGAAPKADGGLLVLDEIDKTNWDITALNDPMEDGELTVNKAGIDQTLQTEISVVAAANPKHGRFRKDESIGEQIDFPESMLSRMDIIIPFEDIIDPERDKEIMRHVLNPEPVETDTGTDPQTLMRKWTQMAEEYHPTVEPDSAAEDRIAEIYSGIRSMMSETDGDQTVPMNSRDGLALSRLAKAHARMCFKDRVEVEDVEAVNPILQQSLALLGYDVDERELADKPSHDTDDDDGEAGKEIYDEEQKTVTDDDYSESEDVDQTLLNVVPNNSTESESVIIGEVADRTGANPNKVKHQIQDLMEKGKLYYPESGELRQC